MTYIGNLKKLKQHKFYDKVNHKEVADEIDHTINFLYTRFKAFASYSEYLNMVSSNHWDRPDFDDEDRFRDDDDRRQYNKFLDELGSMLSCYDTAYKDPRSEIEAAVQRHYDKMEDQIKQQIKHLNALLSAESEVVSDDYADIPKSDPRYNSTPIGAQTISNLSPTDIPKSDPRYNSTPIGVQYNKVEAPVKPLQQSRLNSNLNINEIIRNVEDSADKSVADLINNNPDIQSLKLTYYTSDKAREAIKIFNCNIESAYAPAVCSYIADNSQYKHLNLSDINNGLIRLSSNLIYAIDNCIDDYEGYSFNLDNTKLVNYSTDDILNIFKHFSFNGDTPVNTYTASTKTAIALTKAYLTRIDYSEFLHGKRLHIYDFQGLSVILKKYLLLYSTRFYKDQANKLSACIVTEYVDLVKELLNLAKLTSSTKFDDVENNSNRAEQLMNLLDQLAYDILICRVTGTLLENLTSETIYFENLYTLTIEGYREAAKASEAKREKEEREAEEAKVRKAEYLELVNKYKVKKDVPVTKEETVEEREARKEKEYIGSMVRRDEARKAKRLEATKRNENYCSGDLIINESDLTRPLVETKAERDERLRKEALDERERILKKEQEERNRRYEELRHVRSVSVWHDWMYPNLSGPVPKSIEREQAYMSDNSDCPSGYEHWDDYYKADHSL